MPFTEWAELEIYSIIPKLVKILILIKIFLPYINKLNGLKLVAFPEWAELEIYRIMPELVKF